MEGVNAARSVDEAILSLGRARQMEDTDPVGASADADRAAKEARSALDDFDLVYAYPWDGETPMLMDFARQYGDPNAQLLIMDSVEGLRVVEERKSVA